MHDRLECEENLAQAPLSASKLGSGDGYQYSHDHADGIASQEYLGVDREYYQPVERGYERELQQRLVQIRKKLKEVE